MKMKLYKNIGFIGLLFISFSNNSMHMAEHIDEITI